MSDQQKFDKVKDAAGSGPNNDDPENSTDPLPPVENVNDARRDEQLPTHNGEEYNPDDWSAWDEAHPEENWIAYSDASTFPPVIRRVPVWYYFTLGL